jgi:hypothetical protein
METVRRLMLWLGRKFSRQGLTYKYLTHPYAYGDRRRWNLVSSDKGKDSFLTVWRNYRGDH